MPKSDREVPEALMKWRELRDFLEPKVALHFKSPETFREALEIAKNESIHFFLSGRTDLVVPQGLVCIFKHLKPQRVRIVHLSPEDRPEAPFGPLKKLSMEEKKKRIARLRKNV